MILNLAPSGTEFIVMGQKVATKKSNKMPRPLTPYQFSKDFDRVRGRSTLYSYRTQTTSMQHSECN